MKLFILLSIFSIFCTAPAWAETVLTIQRVNFKNFKKLHYDLIYSAATCEIKTSTPFDVYYRDNASGERLPDFSSDSQDYFGPRIDRSRLSPTAVALEFKAFDEIQNATRRPAEILVRLEKVGNRCKARAEISYEGRAFTLENIDIKVKTFLGLPSGVEWVRLDGSDSEGKLEDCVVGNCPR